MPKALILTNTVIYRLNDCFILMKRTVKGERRKAKGERRKAEGERLKAAAVRKNFIWMHRQQQQLLPNYTLF
jgi:hypothetical protein